YIGRVRIVRQPLTDYQRYQFAWGIPGNIAAGEDIRVLDLTESDLEIPDFDFWLFDATRVVRLSYRRAGSQIDRGLVDVDRSVYRDWKRLAIEASGPSSTYVESQGVPRT